LVGVIGTVDIKYIHYIVIGIFLMLIYNLFYHSYKDDREKRSRFKYQLKHLTVENSMLLKIVKRPHVDALFKEAGLSSYITSTRFNTIRYGIAIIVIFLSVAGSQLGNEIISRSQVLIILALVALTIPAKYFPLYYLLGFIRKRHKREKGNEVYSLYNQLKAEFQSENDRVSNMYNLLLSYRKYFMIIRPAIEKALTKWRISPEIAWNTFAVEVGTEEAENLAMLMKEIEGSSIENAYILLEQKREEFANANYNSFKDYLKDREFIIFVMVYICALSIFGNLIVAHFLQYQEIINFMNRL
jgi:hypothetical protein